MIPTKQTELPALAVDDILACSGRNPSALAHDLGLSVRELRRASMEGARGYVAEALAEYEAGLPRAWRVSARGGVEPCD